MLPRDVIARFEPHWPRETLPERFARVCRTNADRVAVIDGERTLSFEELAMSAAGFAGHLSARGIGPGDVVSWQLPNWWEASVVHHGAVLAGAISNPLNPAFRARELTHVVQEAKPKMLVVPTKWRGFEHGALATTLGIEHVLTARAGGLDVLLEKPNGHPPPPPADPSTNAVLLYTSGTTALPKGVLHTHRALLCEMDSFVDIHSLTPRDRYLGGAPVGHIAGLVYGVMTPGALGTSTVLLDRWDPARASSLEGVTFMTGPPTFLLSLAEAARDRMDGFRLFSTGGASIPTEQVRAAGKKLGCLVKRAYGSTEIPTLTATRVDDDEQARLETDGHALGGAEIQIVDGEIRARAPEMFVGYASGARAFTDDGWYRTGDLGMLDEEGFLRVTGRLGDFIIRGGENISAKEIEDLLLEHPAVAEVAIVGMPDERLGERVAAFVVVRDGGVITHDDIVAFFDAQGVAKHKVPERVEVRKGLPKTESGKVLKTELRAEL